MRSYQPFIVSLLHYKKKFYLSILKIYIFKCLIMKWVSVKICEKNNSLKHLTEFSLKIRNELIYFVLFR